MEVETLRRALSEAEAERGGDGSSGTGGSRGVFDASLSTIGMDETDRAHPLSGIYLGISSPQS